MTHEKGYYHLLVYMIIYFFFNGFLLPEGLLFTTILTPVMLYFLYKYRETAPSPAWIILIIVPLLFQWLHGVDTRTFLVSCVLMFSAVIFLFTASVLLRNYERLIHDLFKTILVINAILVGLALLILPFAAFRDWLWYTVPLSAGIDAWPRLKLFTYEPSYYALIMMPVFLFFIYRAMFEKEKHTMIMVMACLVPLILALSFGVIGSAAIAILFTLVFFWKRLPVFFRRIFLYSVIISIVAMAILVVAWPGNPVFLRMENIFEGKDTSAMGRLVYSFMFAKDLAFRNSWLFGIGPGQIKILAHDLIVNHYQYHGAVAETVRIPNAMAEILASFGLYGFILKLFIEIWFFVKKRIYANVFAFTLFVFVFIYQFTGSFIVNVAELGAWALIFNARFAEFEWPLLQKGKEANT